MALCCKKGRYQRRFGILVPPKQHSNGTGTTGITVLRRDGVVMAGLRIRLTGWSALTTSDTVLRRRLVTACHGRCSYIDRASACAFITTERALTEKSLMMPRYPAKKHTINNPTAANALTCCVPVFPGCQQFGNTACLPWRLDFSDPSAIRGIPVCRHANPLTAVSCSEESTDYHSGPPGERGVASASALIVAPSSLPRCHTVPPRW